MKRVRAIVKSLVEPQDKEVLWYNKGELLHFVNGSWQPFYDIDASDILYETEEDSDIKTLEQALDKLMYEVPVILEFNLEQSGVHETGTKIKVLDFNWKYNKKNIRYQRLNDIELPINARVAKFNITITEDTSFELYAKDNKNSVLSKVDIKFVDYMYWGTQSLEGIQRTKYRGNPYIAGLTVQIPSNDYLWIFIPNSCGYTKIWHNNVDSTEDFNIEPKVFKNDYGVNIEGTLYVSKHPALGNITLNFT